MWRVAKQGLSVYCLEKGTVTIAENSLSKSGTIQCRHLSYLSSYTWPMLTGRKIKLYENLLYSPYAARWPFPNAQCMDLWHHIWGTAAVWGEFSTANTAYVQTAAASCTGLGCRRMLSLSEANYLLQNRPVVVWTFIAWLSLTSMATVATCHFDGQNCRWS